MNAEGITKQFLIGDVLYEGTFRVEYDKDGNEVSNNLVAPPTRVVLPEEKKPLVLNLHKYILDKLLPATSREISPDYITSVIGWASTDPVALYLLGLGEIEYTAERLDIALLSLEQTSADEELKQAIKTIIRNIKDLL